MAMVCCPWRFQNVMSHSRNCTVRVFLVPAGVYSPTRKRKKKAITIKSEVAWSPREFDRPSLAARSWNTSTGRAIWDRGGGSWFW
jgi:hypothetical protein